MPIALHAGKMASAQLSRTVEQAAAGLDADKMRKTACAHFRLSPIVEIATQPACKVVETVASHSVAMNLAQQQRKIVGRMQSVAKRIGCTVSAELCRNVETVVACCIGTAVELLASHVNSATFAPSARIVETDVSWIGMAVSPEHCLNVETVSPQLCPNVETGAC